MSKRPDFGIAVRRIRNTAVPFTAAVNVCKGIFEQGEIAGAGDRAELLAEIERLTALLQSQETNRVTIEEWSATKTREIERLTGDRAALLAVVEAARETLGRYGWHKTSCGLWFVAPPPAGRERPWRAGDEVNCNCGLAAALARLDGDKRKAAVDESPLDEQGWDGIK